MCDAVSRIVMHLGAGVLYNLLSCKNEFRENRLNDGYTLLNGANKFIPVISTFLGRCVTSGIEYLRIVPVSSYEIRENRCSESHT